MSSQTFAELIINAVTDGPTLTSAAAASCIPTAERKVLPVVFDIKKSLRIELGGRISCAVTTPGSARFDVRLGSAGNTIVFDSGAINLNVVAKVTVPWYFSVDLECRSVGTGTGTTFFPHNGVFRSEAVVGSPLPSAGGNGVVSVPVGTPAVGAGTDNTATHILDCFFTQTVGTGSLTVHTYKVWLLN